MELWDLYNIHRQPLHRTHQRGTPLAEGTYHTIVHCCVLDGNGNMLIQQRQPFKDGWANLWDVTVGGSALSGESSQQAIQRELLEELSIDHDFTNIRPRLTLNFPAGFDDIYVITRQIDVDSLTFQYSEVQGARWASLEEILHMIDNGTFICYHQHLIRLLLDSNFGYGAIQYM